MKKKIIKFILKFLLIDKRISELEKKINILNHEYDHLVKNSNRQMRRRWHRMLNNEKSPFYIGDGKVNRRLLM